jgi:hypothetical protein
MEQVEETLQDNVELEEPLEAQENVEETETEETESEVTEPEYEEIDYNGQKYKVPPELKEAVLRHEDYTKKTQEVAETRKALEAEHQAFQQAVQVQQQNMQGHAQLAAIQSQLEQYQNVNWSEWSQNDSQAAQQAFFQYSQLKDAAGNLTQQLQRTEAESLHKQRALHVKRLEQGKAELQRDIPGWNDEIAHQIVDHATSYGFSDSELKSILDPRVVRVLNDARLYRQSLKKATSKPEAPPAKPASKVAGKAPVKPDPEKMSTEDWLKWRNKQLVSR